MKSTSGGAASKPPTPTSATCRLREPPLDRGGGGRAADRPEFSAAPAARALRRAVERHLLHRAAGGEPPLMALPDPALGEARPGVRGGGRGPDPDRALPREQPPDHAASLAPDPDPGRGANGLPLRASHDRHLRRRGDAGRHGEPRLRGRRLDGPQVLPECGRRAPRGAAAPPHPVPHRARHPRRGAGRDRGHPARRQVPRRAGRRPHPRLCVRELRRGADPPRARDRSAPTASQTSGTSCTRPRRTRTSRRSASSTARRGGGCSGRCCPTRPWTWWHGTATTPPCKYDLRRFSPVGATLFDHPARRSSPCSPPPRTCRAPRTSTSSSFRSAGS